MQKFSISIIIPNYNSKKLLEKNLPKVVVAAQNTAAQIIIVDDGSQDDSIDFLQSSYPQIRVYKQEKNKGFASTVNFGVSQANSDLVVLLNSDIVPEKDFLQPIMEDFSNNEKLFAVGCLDKSYEKGKIVERGKGVGYWYRGLFMHRAGKINNNDQETDWVSGGSSVYRRDLWNKLGGMDEKFNPFYYEDIDLSYRAKKVGYDIVFECRSLTHHYHEEGTIKNQYTFEQIQTAAFRNQLYFSWKHGNRLKMFLWLPYHLLMGTIKNKNSFFVKGFLAFCLR